MPQQAIQIGQHGIVYNHDILGIVRRVNRFIAELLKSASAGTSAISEHDLNRLKSYLAAARAYEQWILAQPQLDLPETHPQQYDIPEAPVASEIESDDIADLVNLWSKLRDELVSSQSARLPSGLISHDSVRLRAVMDKIEAFTEYLEQTSPQDLPNSSPRAEMYGSGRTGV